ncbi:hypothetical protein J4Q44_G00291570, partial [Coregonus suidteri]
IYKPSDQNETIGARRLSGVSSGVPQELLSLRNIFYSQGIATALLEGSGLDSVSMRKRCALCSPDPCVSRWCFFMAFFSVKRFPQSGHWYGFSPVWVSMCVFSVFD